MILTLVLPPKLEERLQEESDRRELTAAEYAIQVLDQHLPLKNWREEFVLLLQAWMEEDNAQEQQELGDYLIKTLDDDRFLKRQLFPKELEGITW
jgi:hypothetical protein